MNGAVEDMLREGLDRLTAEVRVPAGVTGRARAHLRRKKIAVRAALAGGTAAVTAAAVVAATAPGQGNQPLTNAHTTAYVLSRVESALAAPNKVVQTATTFSAAFPPVLAWNYRDDLRLTQSGYIAPSLDPGMPWAQGRVTWGVGSTTIHGKQAYVQIDYRRHEWYRTSDLVYSTIPCTAKLDIVEFNAPSNWAAYLRNALSCGVFKVAGHAQAAGLKTIVLTGSMVIRDFWKGLPGAVGRGPLRVDATLYVDPATYFPVLGIWHNRTHYRDGRPLTGTVRVNITLLPATPGNIAQANVPFPTGFRKVPGFTFGGPVMPYFTSG
jgi:hypothetical protein